MTVDNFKTVDKIVKLTEPLLSIKRSSRSMNCDIYIFNTKRCYFILDQICYGYNNYYK
jgi:hypothetical protein